MDWGGLLRGLQAGEPRSSAVLGSWALAAARAFSPNYAGGTFPSHPSSPLLSPVSETISFPLDKMGKERGEPPLVRLGL